MPRYTIEESLRKDRKNTMHGIGGGIIVYVRLGLTVLSFDNFNSDFNQYCSFNVLSSDSEPINIIAVYRSPNSSNSNWSKLCELLRNKNNNSVMIGDINLSKIDWETYSTDPKGREFLKATQTNFVSQMITFPTYSKGNTLDLLLTKKPEKVASITDVGPIGRSDQTAILVEFHHKSISNKSVQYVYEQGLLDGHEAYQLDC